MIFVTVGTHEQQFDRLVEYIDKLKQDSTIGDEVIIQKGFCTYEPRYCKCQKLFSYSEMRRHMADARIVITHGGPSSFIAPLEMGKIPIVVPRKKEFGEHVNNHQVSFCRAVAERQKNIIVVEEMHGLQKIIEQYDSIIAGMCSEMRSNNDCFCIGFSKLVKEIL